MYWLGASSRLNLSVFVIFLWHLTKYCPETCTKFRCTHHLSSNLIFIIIIRLKQNFGSFWIDELNRYFSFLLDQFPDNSFLFIQNVSFWTNFCTEMKFNTLLTISNKNLQKMVTVIIPMEGLKYPPSPQPQNRCQNLLSCLVNTK